MPWRPFTLVLLLPAAAAHPLLVAVAPDLPGSGPGDEGFGVGCEAACDLSGWSVTDGRGLLAFPPGTRLAAGATAWAAGNATTWAAHGGPPATAWRDPRLVLANDGDTLRLVDPGGADVDAFTWGPAGLHASSPGLVFERARVATGWRDTDSVSDWVGPRLHRIGETAIDEPTFPVHRLTLYASPDSSFATLAALVAGATHRLQLHTYELRSAALADALASARQRHAGLDLQVLVEAAPAGLTASSRHATADALRRIQDVGGHAMLAGSGRYDDHHLKVLVADDAVAVQSENWVESGVPEDPTWGNRGWGVVVHDAAVADWFAAWMARDRAAWDVAAFDLPSFDPLFSVPDRTVPRSGAYGPGVPAAEIEGDFLVTPVIAPDHTADPESDPVLALVAAAHDRVLTEQLELATGARNRLGWHRGDPLLEALEDAALRGVDVQVLAATPRADDDGNRPALDALAAHGVATAWMDRPGIALLHNKGFVVDDVAVVGSMNGNQHSRGANREADLIVRGPGVAAYFAALFASDAQGARPGPDIGVVGQDLRGLPGAPLPILLAVLGVAVAVRRCSTSRSGPGPPWP